MCLPTWWFHQWKNVWLHLICIGIINVWKGPSLKNRRIFGLFLGRFYVNAISSSKYLHQRLVYIVWLMTDPNAPRRVKLKKKKKEKLVFTQPISRVDKSSYAGGFSATIGIQWVPLIQQRTTCQSNLYEWSCSTGLSDLRILKVQIYILG